MPDIPEECTARLFLPFLLLYHRRYSQDDVLRSTHPSSACGLLSSCLSQRHDQNRSTLRASKMAQRVWRNERLLSNVSFPLTTAYDANEELSFPASSDVLSLQTANHALQGLNVRGHIAWQARQGIDWGTWGEQEALPLPHHHRSTSFPSAAFDGTSCCGRANAHRPTIEPPCC